MPLNCEDLIRQQLGRSMTEAEVLNLADEARALADKARAALNGADPRKTIRDLTAKRGADKELELLARARATELQSAAKLNAVNYAIDNFQGMEWEGISAMMVGSKYVRPGARLSVDALRSSLTGKYVGGLMADLEGLGPAWELLRKGKLEKEIMEALYVLDNQNAQPYAGPVEGMEIAKVIHKWQELARLDENDAGAWIGKLPGYIMRQCHDADRIRRAGFAAWKEEMLKRLDWEHTLGGALDGQPEAVKVEFLQHTYDNIITGMHAASNNDALSRASVVGSMAAKASKERVLHFKSGADFHAYNLRFGKGNLMDGVIAGLGKSANDTSLMRVFGPSPQANLQNMIGEIREVFKARGDVESIRKMNSWTKRLNNQMKELDGTLNIEGNPSFAEISRTVRALQSMAKLGGAVISGFSDIPLMAQEFHYQGAGYFKSLAEGLRLFAKGRGSLEERQILSACGVFFDSMCGSLMARFAGNELPGRVAGLMNTFFKLNGLSFWSDAWKKSATLMMSHDLANLAGANWSALGQARQRSLNLYNIDEPLWDLLRKGQMKAADGRDYFTPELAAQIPAKELEAYMGARGMLTSGERTELFREEVASRLRAYFRDRVQYAILEPDARTQSILHQGLAAGTAPGELLRFCAQFKSFPAAFIQRTLGREIYGRGADSLMAGLAQAVIPKNGEFTGLAGMILMTTIFGYLSMTSKELLAGKNPRPLDTAEDFKNVFVASLLQGGGAGIFGDFLFGEKSRMGDDFLSTLAGPTMGLASQINQLYKSARDGQDVESQTFRTVWSNLPGNNLFWLRPAMNHLILYSAYEYMNPGYIKRLRKRIKKENNQTFWAEPHLWDWSRRGKRKGKKK